MTRPVTHAEVARQMQMIVDCSVLSAALRNGQIDEAGVLLGKAIDNYPEIEAGLLSVAKATLDLLIDRDLLTEAETERAHKLARSANARVASMTSG
ncbi:MULTISPECIES: hypothetical protein [unclassified Aeromicrobium]|uniref:hypothetical protein n=1 Tax=unclassified Aeromicrobium TaxID=2633570 RepID=UPI00396B3069